MGNALKSANSKKSNKLLHTKKIFKDHATPIILPNYHYTIGDISGRIIKGGVPIETMLRFGFPDRGPEMYHYKCHTFCFNRVRRVAFWTMELIDLTNFPLNRRGKSKFKPEFKFDDGSPHFRANDSDFWDNTPIPLTCVENHLHDKEKLLQAQLYTNTVPLSGKAVQHKLWKDLENMIKSLIVDFRMNRVWVVSGPVYIGSPKPNCPLEGSVTTHLTKGNQMHMPSHFFKALLVENNGQLYQECFLIPADMIESDDIWSYRIASQTLEQRIGFLLFDKVNYSQLDHVKHIFDEATSRKESEIQREIDGKAKVIADKEKARVDEHNRAREAARFEEAEEIRIRDEGLRVRAERAKVEADNRIIKKHKEDIRKAELKEQKDKERELKRVASEAAAAEAAEAEAAAKLKSRSALSRASSTAIGAVSSVLNYGFSFVKSKSADSASASASASSASTSAADSPRAPEAAPAKTGKSKSRSKRRK